MRDARDMTMAELLEASDKCTRMGMPPSHDELVRRVRELRSWLISPLGPLYKIHLAGQAVQSDEVLRAIARPDLARDLWRVERVLGRFSGKEDE